MSLISKFNLGKLIFCLVTFVTVNACAITRTDNIESYIGLYEIINSECDIAQEDFDPCKDTLFFEILKGQFIGVKDNELAYVFWSGVPKIDSELQYTSHLLRNHESSKISGNKFWLSNDSESQEYLIFSDGMLIGYHVVYNAGDKAKHRVIHYKLKPVRRGNLPLVRLNYPGNK